MLGGVREEVFQNCAMFQIGAKFVRQVARVSRPNPTRAGGNAKPRRLRVVA
jgi:hypothetical protein